MENVEPPNCAAAAVGLSNGFRSRAVHRNTSNGSTRCHCACRPTAVGPNRAAPRQRCRPVEARGWPNQGFLLAYMAWLHCAAFPYCITDLPVRDRRASEAAIDSSSHQGFRRAPRAYRQLNRSADRAGWPQRSGGQVASLRTGSPPLPLYRIGEGAHALGRAGRRVGSEASLKCPSPRPNSHSRCADCYS